MAKAKKSSVNPLTGTSDPNTYTQVTDRDLPPAVNVRPLDLSGYEERVKSRSRRQYLQYSASGEGRVLHDVPGWGDVNMDGLGWSNTPPAFDGEGSPKASQPILDPVFFQRMLGPQKPPTVTSGPAINEPHEAGPHHPVIRRAEDLTGDEYQKGVDALALGGVTPSDVKTNIRDSIDRANMRAILAGETRMAGEGFYGGDTAPNRMIEAATRKVLSHPSGRITDSNTARAAAVAAVSATSPKNKVEQVKKDGTVTNPNQIAADTGIQAGLDKVPITHYPAEGGIRGNMDVAADRVDKIADGTPLYESGFKGVKTTAFAAAQYQASGPDSYRVSDVHSTRTVVPHTSHSKGSMMLAVDSGGKSPASHLFFPEDMGGDGLPKPSAAQKRLADHGMEDRAYTPKMSEQKPGQKPKPIKSNSLGEVVLGRGGLPVHAIADRASREVAFDLGWTPSVNHAQAQNAIQEIDWRDQQIIRPDQPYNMDTEYPGWRKKMGVPEDGEVDPVTAWIQSSRSGSFQEGAGR